MYRYCCIALYALLVFAGLSLEALHRDNLLIYDNVSDENRIRSHLIDNLILYNEHNPNCPMHNVAFPEILLESYQQLPKVGPPCPGCGQPLPFLGYFEVFRGLEFEFSTGSLCAQLNYTKENRSCTCYWPERSQKAAKISDTAYELFDDLFSTTALAGKLASVDGRFNLGCDGLSKHGVISTLIVRKLHFADYYLLCRNIEAYAKCTFTHEEALKITDKLDAIIERLYTLFFDLYSSCYAQHPHTKIASYLSYMRHLANDFSDGFPFSDDIQKTPLESAQLIKSDPLIDEIHIQAKDINVNYEKTFELDQHLETGVLLNDLKLYESAISELTKAIPTHFYRSPPYNPEFHGPLYHLESRKVALIERACARFELDQIDKALNNYRIALKASEFPRFGSMKEFKRNPDLTMFRPVHKSFPYRKAICLSKEKIEFATGLIVGATEGANLSIKEFLPSLCSSFNGLMNGLWAFACAPVEVSEELIESAIAVGEFFSSHSSSECLQHMVPEIRELALTWHTLNDSARGRKIGFIIGKYGVDIFMPVGIVNGVAKVRALIRANAMLTFERMAATQASRTAIYEQTVEWVTAGTELLEEHRIIAKNGNAMCHIMQKKHDWHKLIPLTGDVEKDFAKVAELLEESGIYDEAFIIGEPVLFSAGDTQIRKTVHKMTINGLEVEAEFITYLEEEETSFLQDAWVKKQ